MKGADQCPRCASRRTRDVEQQVTPFYAGTVRVCANCGAAWEPFDTAELLDASDPLSCFTQPCDNCAFRPGSVEQKDKQAWRDLIDKLGSTGGFHCHKGVPLTPGKDHGFAYPKDARGQYLPKKLRLCRGYLNALDARLRRQFGNAIAPMSEKRQ